MSALGVVLRERGIPHALIDIDELRKVWPQPDHDPFHETLALENLGALVHNDRAAGARTIVAASVVEREDIRARCQSILGDDLVVVRLTASLETLEQRLRRRHENDPARLAWHLARTVELDEILRRNGLDDAVIETDGLSSLEIAARILALTHAD